MLTPCLRQGALLATIWIAFLVWGSRLLGIYSGSWLGAWLGGTPAEARRKIWQGMITQVHASRPYSIISRTINGCTGVCSPYTLPPPNANLSGIFRIGGGLWNPKSAFCTCTLECCQNALSLTCIGSKEWHNSYGMS